MDPYLALVTINNATLCMEIDTGSALTHISKATFSQLWPDRNSSPTWRVQKSPENLYWGGTGGGGKVCGEGKVWRAAEDLGLVMVGGSGPSLLGRDWLGRFKLDWREVHRLHAAPDTPDTLHRSLPE